MLRVHLVISFVLLLLACSSTALSTTSTETLSTAPSAVPCPRTDYAIQSCPAAICPTCPTVKEPQATSWFCTEVRGSSGQTDSGCWAHLDGCQSYRRMLAKHGFRRISECRVQRVAYCFQVLDRITHARQTGCMRTESECLRARRQTAANPPAPNDIVTECAPALNSDPFTELRLHRATLTDE